MLANRLLMKHVSENTSEDFTKLFYCNNALNYFLKKTFFCLLSLYNFKMPLSIENYRTLFLCFQLFPCIHFSNNNISLVSIALQDNNPRKFKSTMSYIEP